MDHPTDLLRDPPTRTLAWRDVVGSALVVACVVVTAVALALLQSIASTPEEIVCQALSEAGGPRLSVILCVA